MEIGRPSLLFVTCCLAPACLSTPSQGEFHNNVKRSACDCSGYVCGTPNRGSRIVGGDETNPGKYPWLVSLSYRGKLYCGATLVNDRYLVTAAHCIKRVTKGRVQIVLGSHNKSDIHEPSRQVRKVGEWWAHPGFDRRTFNNDIGVIKLDSPVAITKFVRPVCLPTQDRSYVGDFGIVPGWGRISENGRSSDVVREVKVPIMSNSECKTKKYNPSEITDNMMCAGYDAGQIDACQGDSGGPMLWEKEASSQINLIGVVSWGQGCARAGYPGIYTRIHNYRSFIDTYIGEGCFCPSQ